MSLLEELKKRHEELRAELNQIEDREEKLRHELDDLNTAIAALEMEAELATEDVRGILPTSTAAETEAGVGSSSPEVGFTSGAVQQPQPPQGEGEARNFTAELHERLEQKIAQESAENQPLIREGVNKLFGGSPILADETDLQARTESAPVYSSEHEDADHDIIRLGEKQDA